MHAKHEKITLSGDLRKAALTSGILLLVPLVAMQFTREVAWSGADFALAAVLLSVAVLAGLRAARLRGPVLRRVAAVGAVALVFGAVWVELAVGVFFRLGS